MFQPIEVAEQQVPAFVDGVPASEADRQVARVHADVGHAVDVINELPLGLVVRLPDFMWRNAQRVTKGEILFAPAGDVPVEQRLKRLAGPGRRMHSVGDRVDAILGEHLPQDFGVSLGDAVGVVTQVERQVGHVQVVVPREHGLHRRNLGSAQYAA